MVPATVVLVVGLMIGADLTGGVPGLIALYFAAAAFCAIAALWGVFMAVTFRTQQAGPLMQQGVFLAVFLSTAYTPQVLLRGWLGEAAHLNPVTHVLEMARQATVVGIEPSLAHTLPGRRRARRHGDACSARWRSGGWAGWTARRWRS